MSAVLIVDDEIQIRTLISLHLENNSFEVIQASSGHEAIQYINNIPISLIILDLMMEEGNGYDVLNYIKDKEYDVRVIVLSARSELKEKITTLGLGADDYVTKPFSPIELVARVQAQLRRYQPHMSHPANILKLNKLVLDIDNLTLKNDNKVYPLTPVECSLLQFFIQNPDRILTKREIYKSVWKHENFDGNNLSVYISKLRTVLQPTDECPHFIHSIRGIGYRFSGDGQ